jgi:hypothetical protein
VLKAERVTAPAGPPGVRFAPPVGTVPVVLTNIMYPSASEALRFNQEANESLEDWLAVANLTRRPAGGGGGGVAGHTTGTKCTSLFCFEKTADDLDTPKPTRPPQGGVLGQ